MKELQILSKTITANEAGTVTAFSGTEYNVSTPVWMSFSRTSIKVGTGLTSVQESGYIYI